MGLRRPGRSGAGPRRIRYRRSGWTRRRGPVPGLAKCGDGLMSELKLITPRRNFLIRALGFTAAGATLPIGLVAADDPRARIAHHQAELEKAWRDYYGLATVRTYADVRPAGAP